MSKKIICISILAIIIILFFIFLFYYDPYKPIILWNPIVNFFGKNKNLNNIMWHLYDNRNVFLDEFLKVQEDYIYRIKPVSYISDHDKILTGNDNMWNLIPIRFLGDWRNVDLFPQTISLLKPFDRFLSTAYFSIMDTGKILPFHYGVYAGTQRMHIPIIVPDGNAALEIIDGTIYRWSDGPFYFEDYEYHRAWNLSDGKRVVLIIDFIKDLPFGIKQLNDIFFKLSTLYANKNIFK